MTKKNVRRRTQSKPGMSIAGGLFLIGVAVIILAVSFSSGHAGSEDRQEQNAGAPLSVSFPAPELRLENLEGKTESLADFREQVVLVNNWATWCPPCKAEMPVLEAYYEDHAREGFLIIAVEAGEPADVVAQFAREFNLQFHVWLDPNSASIRAFGNGALPNSYVIDRKGVVRYAWTGGVSRAVLDKYITPLIEE